jgi:cell division protein FtsB
MKKALVVMVVLLMAVSLLPGCSCGGVSSEAVEGLQQNLTALQDEVNTVQESITALEQQVSALEG